MVHILPARSAVPVEETWDLSSLLNGSTDFNEELTNLEKQALALNKKFKGTINDSKMVILVLTDYMLFTEKLVLVSTHANLTASTDQTNDKAQLQASKFGATAAKIGSQLSFITSELLSLSTETLEQAMEESTEFRVFLKNLLRQKPYQLHPEAEKSLAAFSSTFNAPYSLYNTTKMADINFGDFEVNGQKYPLSYGSFEGDWEVETNTKLRRAAFDAFSTKLKEYQQTTAKTFDMQLQTEKTTADLRGYASIFDYLLFDQEVDRSLYDRQIDLITSELASHMQKYAKLLQRVHGLDQMTFADLKISLDPSYEPEITVAQSKQYIDDALAIMGPDYIKMVDRSYSERWIDFAQNKGKSTGAFCSSPYGDHPYILISWTGRMNEVFVLAHELGHAGHFYHAHQEQNIFNGRPSLYFIEAPSTMNEMLVANHLLKDSSDLKFRRWVISSIVARTYYHNFVTHLLEAAYQRKVYKRIDAGQSVNAGILNELKRGVLEDFWGDAVDINDGAELTWMRQPHYYMGLYPYTYSAGLTISTQVSKRILSEGQPAVDEWLEVLKAGGTQSPTELAQMAGVDITTEQPLRDTISYIGELIDELVYLTDEIEKADGVEIPQS